jgi:hypothetical protein
LAKKTEGLAVAVKWPKCHFDNPSDSRFYGNCAAPLYKVSGAVEKGEIARGHFEK